MLAEHRSTKELSSRGREISEISRRVRSIQAKSKFFFFGVEISRQHKFEAKDTFAGSETFLSFKKKEQSQSI